jgi:branched-chain amino acid transport system substrate-binding protein
MKFFYLTLFVFILSGMSACKNRSIESSLNVIRIGEVLPMTGAEATLGVQTHRGIQLAIDEYNQNVPPKGTAVKLISMDDQGKPEEAAMAMQNLVSQKVIAVLGEASSSRTLVIAPLAQRAHIPLVTPSATNPIVTEVGNYIFRICFIDPFQGAVMARFACEHLHLKRIAILKDLKSDYSVGLADYFGRSFQRRGGVVPLVQSYSAGDIDFKSQLTAIRAQKVDAVFIPGYYTDVGLIAKQARDLGLSIPLLGGDGWESPRLFEIAGTAVENSYFSNHFSDEEDTPVSKLFVKKYQELFGVRPDASASLGYDAARVLLEAIHRTTHASSTVLRDQLVGIQNFAGVTGNITIDDKRNAVKSAIVLKIQGGYFKPELRISGSESTSTHP